VILGADDLVAAWPHIAERHGRVPLCDAVAVRQCCECATTLAAGDLLTEPAAMFFAFADRRRAFPFGWKLMADFITRAQAHANGLELEVTREELDDWCIAVLHRRAGWETVRDWFAERVKPRALA
jgi:hypothetical protein